MTTPNTQLTAQQELEQLETRKRELLQQLQQEGNTPGRTPLDTSAATPVCFTADLADDDRVKDKTHVNRNMWFRGVTNAKGPKGGVYFNGRVVIGWGAAQKKGWLKMGARHLEALQKGESVPAYIQFDGTREQVIVGVMTNYKAKPV